MYFNTENRRNSSSSGVTAGTKRRRGSGRGQGGFHNFLGSSYTQQYEGMNGIRAVDQALCSQGNKKEERNDKMSGERPNSKHNVK